MPNHAYGHEKACAQTETNATSGTLPIAGNSRKEIARLDQSAHSFIVGRVPGNDYMAPNQRIRVHALPSLEKYRKYNLLP